MIETAVLILTLLLFLLIMAVIGRAVIKKRQVIGQPPVPVFYFILAKLLVGVNLLFLLMRGLKIPVHGIFEPVQSVELIALALLIIGFVILFLSTLQLNKDLIFGLSSSGDHHLQMRGVFSVTRHPFYIGFIFILLSSCLFNPHWLNIAAFAGAWLIHHFIMIEEERFLISKYGETYVTYSKRVKRYVII
jgi:protein-S-isoprenylcysteine O-methyltransferase Ste14